MQSVRGGHATARTFFTQHNVRTYEVVARCATFCRDTAWKSEVIRRLGKEHHFVLELASGTGLLSKMLLSAGRDVVGLDLVFEYLRHASENKLDMPLAQGTAEILPYRDASFDAVVSSYLVKYVDPVILVGECWRVLMPGGMAVFHDFTYPRRSEMQTLWKTYFSILRFCGILARSWRIVFEQLDNVIRESNWEEALQLALAERGFKNLSCKHYTAGTAAIVTAEKP